MKKQSIQMILQRRPKRKYLVSLLAVVLVVGGVFGLRALSHETVYISGLLEYKSVDDLFAQSSLVAVGQITGHSDAIRVHRLHVFDLLSCAGAAGYGHGYGPRPGRHRRQRHRSL